MLRLLIALLFCFATTAAHAGTVYYNGHVLTMNASADVAEAFFVHRGRIRAVGTTTAMKKYLSTSTQGVDLKGRTVIPGIIDAHGHFPASGLSEVGVDLNSPPIGPVKTVNDALRLLKAKARQLPAGRWIYAFGYDETLIQEGRLLTLQELNAVSTAHPIYVQHTSGHQGMSNRKGLEVMGYTDATPDPPGGHFGRDQAGRLTGLMLETASDPSKRASLNGPVWDRLKIIQVANAEYLAQGVTTAQSGASPHILVNALSWLSKFQLIPLRVVVYPMEENGREWVNGSRSYAQDEHEKFKMGAVKLFVDGSIQAYSGLLNAPYFIPRDAQRPEDLGHNRVSLDTLKAQVLFFHKAGKQTAIHANGDRAIEYVLQAVEYAQQQYYRSDPRHIVIHSQMPSVAQLERMKKVGLTPSFFNTHVYYWGDRHRKLFLGPKRARRIDPLQDALKTGHRFTLHTDTPVVPMEPMTMIWSASERKTRSDYVLGPEQRISRYRALQAITLDAAWQSFLDQELGSVEPGKRADFVILSANPLTVQDVRKVQVLETYIDGRRMYRRSP